MLILSHHSGLIKASCHMSNMLCSLILAWCFPRIHSVSVHPCNPRSEWAQSLTQVPRTFPEKSNEMEQGQQKGSQTLFVSFERIQWIYPQQRLMRWAERQSGGPPSKHVLHTGGKEKWERSSWELLKEKQLNSHNDMSCDWLWPRTSGITTYVYS